MKVAWLNGDSGGLPLPRAGSIGQRSSASAEQPPC